MVFYKNFKLMRIYLIVLIVLSCYHVFSQNLVPNPGFESYTDCPYYFTGLYNSISFADPWESINYASGGTSDLFNSCCTNTYMLNSVDVPSNFAGYQMPHSGNGYAGLGTYVDNDYREYLQAPLLSPLVAGTTYEVKYHLASASDIYHDVLNHFSNGVGAYFSTVKITSQPDDNKVLPLIPQVECNTVVTDTVNWFTFCTTFVATGGEQWIIIGNFNDNANTTIIPMDSYSSGEQGAYYFIDDICVAPVGGCNCDSSELDVSVTSEDEHCGHCDGSAMATASGGVPPYTYQWDSTAGGQTTSTADGLCSGTYSVTVTDDSGISAFNSVIVNEIGGPEIQVSGTDVSCNGGSDGSATVEVTGGTPGYTYTWSNSSTTEDLPGIPAGQYEVTVTDANQCTAVSGITISEPPLLTSVISGSDPLCAGNEGTADVEVSGGTPPYTYFWEPVNETSEDINGLQSGEYTVLITDANGCTITNSIIIDEPYPITTQISGTDLLCYGDVSNGSAGISATGGTQPYIYSWSNGGNTQTIVNIGAGTYTVTVTDQNGCTAEDNITINEPPEFIVTIPEPGWICIGESVSLIANVSGGTPGYSYEWNNGIMEEWNNVSPGFTANYSVSATDINGCQTSANVTVNVYGQLTIDAFPDDTICAGESTVIYANYAGGMGEPYTVTINGIEAELPYTVSPSETTTYSVCVNDECSTPVVCDEAEVVVMDIPPVDFVADIYEGCEPLTVHFNEISEHEGQTYDWNFGDQWGSTSSNSKYPVHVFEEPGEYDVSCTVTDNHGCTNTWTWNEMISVYPDPVASFLPYPQVATILKPMIYFENTSSTYWSSQWDFGDGDQSSDTHPQHKYDTSGTYMVELVVVSEHGCVDTAWSEVIIQDVNTFYAPTAFTPDFDDMNGLFSPVGHGIDPDNWYMAIYDRWGEKIWETGIYDVDEETGKVNHGWDGSIKGGDIGESAVYSWMVIYRDLSGAEHQHTGLVTLIR